MKIYIGCDHAGYELKEKLVPVLTNMGHVVMDMGATSFVADDDYPDYCRPVAEAVAGDSTTMGIVIGGSSVGEAIVANRVSGVRAVGYYGGSIDLIRLSRSHNDANVLSLGARLMPDDEAIYATKMWLSTEFSNDERHARRIKKIDVEDNENA
jgi:ribose 5-phosphate isomerase B